MADFRYWREEKRTYLKDVIPLDTPYNIGIEASSLCNARCVYCAHSTPNHGIYEGNMTMELFERVLREIHRFPKKIKLIETYSFGEPLCNPNLEDMIAQIREEDIAERINFTTNGLLLTSKRIDALMKIKVDTIRILLQGLDAETYQTMCGVRVDFEKFLENLKYLYDHRGVCKVRMKIADIAIKDIPDGHANTLDETIKTNAMNGRGDVIQTEIHKVCHVHSIDCALWLTEKLLPVVAICRTTSNMDT